MTVNWKGLGENVSYMVEVSGPGKDIYEPVSGKSQLKVTGLQPNSGYIITVIVTDGASGIEGTWVETPG